MINIAVIGCGVIAQYHLRALAKLTTARAAAVCDVRPDVAQKTAAEFQVPRWTTRASELFADPSIDAVILALPANLRTALALEAFQHGKHVLTEKPVAMSAAEVRTLLAVQGDRVGAVCSSRYRFFASARAATEFLRTGALGKLRTITCRGVNPAGAPPANPPAWRLRKDLNGGGIFVNWGCYDLDYLLGLLDFKLTPKFALARTWTVGAPYAAYAAPGSDAETHVAALVTFAEGCVLNYERAEFSTLPRDNRWQITGERGTLTLQMLKAPGANVVLTEPDPEKGTRTRVIWEGDESALTTEHDGVAADFADAILQKRKPQTSLQDALLFARIADAIYASAESDGPVTFT
ncbi:MAG: hypothetical protein JWM88_2330 [Verrucomicrobia bacterium]|nr:hypothetical protein [Verrucomicrobiota bacterium]